MTHQWIIYEDLTFLPSRPENTGNGGQEADWYVELTKPVWSKPGLSPGLQQFFNIDPGSLIEPESVSIDRWLLPLAEPVWLKPGLHVTQQLALFWDTFEGIKDTHHVDWFVSWTDPVRLLPDLGVSRKQFFSTDPFSLITVEAVSVDKFAYPLSDPVRRRYRIATGIQISRGPNRSELED